MGLTDTIHELPNVTIKPDNSQNKGKSLTDNLAEFAPKLIGADGVSSLYETQGETNHEGEPEGTFNKKWYKKPLFYIGLPIIIIISIIALSTNSK